MRAAIIAPISLMDRYQRTGYHLALAHLAHHKDYRDFYHRARERGDFTILDNSVIELGMPVSYEDLREACRLIRPSEIVLCDFPKDPKQTYDWAKHYGPYFKDEFPGIKLMVVPQWRYHGIVESWLSSMCHLTELEFIDTVGIPKFLGDFRRQACALLDESPGMRQGLDFHLLGTYDNPLEVMELSRYDWIRGVDSKIPVRLGQLGIAMHPERGLLTNLRGHLPSLDFLNSDDPMPIITSHNCKVYRGWAQGSTMGEVVRLASSTR